MLINTAENLIAGQWLAASEGATAQSINPASGAVMGTYAVGTVADVDRAAAVAREVFESSAWVHSPRQRAQVLLDYADRLDAAKEQIARQMSQENGKLLGEAAHEIMVSVSELRYYAGLARNIFGRTTEIEPSLYAMINSEPLGVAAIIVPWNAPVTLLIRSLAPALAAGCTVIVKPAEQTSLLNKAVISLLSDLPDLPAGVVNVVNGGVDVSQRLVTSLDVDVISYTGSTHVGKLIMADAAQTMKRLNLELGGSAPCLVFPDADLDIALAGIAKAAFAHAGQVCMATSRVFVHSSIADQFEQALAERFRQLKLGMMDDPTAGMGPLINQSSVERVLSLVESSTSAAEVLVQGERPGQELSNGSFLSPSLLRVTSSDAPCLKDEVFGPLVSLIRFTDEQEVIKQSNDTRYGLCGSVWTQDLNLGLRVANKMQCGTVWINQHMRTHAEVEVGGYKESGLGRLHGVEGLMEFMHSKHISYKVS